MNFEEGQNVTFNSEKFPGYTGTYKVIRVESVPQEQILFNPENGTGGVGHHQWVTIYMDGEERLFSGLFFELD